MQNQAMPGAQACQISAGQEAPRSTRRCSEKGVQVSLCPTIEQDIAHFSRNRVLSECNAPFCQSIERFPFYLFASYQRRAAVEHAFFE